jgi:hypothetical protein
MFLKKIKKHLRLLWEAMKEGEIGMRKRMKQGISLEEKVFGKKL